MSRREQGRAIARASFALLSEDKELLWIPAISMVASLVALALLLFPLTIVDSGIISLAFIAIALVSLTFIGMLGNAAIILAVRDRLHGGDPTISSAIEAAWEYRMPILKWSIVSATVGAIIRAIEERLGIVGTLLGFLAGMAWSVVTFMVLPVLIVEEVSVKEAISRSSEILKKTWGQQLRSAFRIGAVFFVPALALIAIAILSAVVGGPMLVLVPLAILGLIGIAMVSNVLQAVFQTVVYDFASTGQVAPGFDRDIMTSVFSGKKRRGE